MQPSPGTCGKSAGSLLTRREDGTSTFLLTWRDIGASGRPHKRGQALRLGLGQDADAPKLLP